MVVMVIVIMKQSAKASYSGYEIDGGFVGIHVYEAVTRSKLSAFQALFPSEELIRRDVTIRRQSKACHSHTFIGRYNDGSSLVLEQQSSVKSTSIPSRRPGMVSRGCTTSTRRSIRRGLISRRNVIHDLLLISVICSKNKQFNGTKCELFSSFCNLLQ